MSYPFRANTKNCCKDTYFIVYERCNRYKIIVHRRQNTQKGFYWEDFYKSKLFYADITQRLNFCICKEIMFCNNTTYFIATKSEETLLYLYGYLNSPIVDWYYRTLSVQLGEKAVRMFSIYVLEIPIPPMIKENDTYKLLGLTPAEIAFIEDREY